MLEADLTDEEAPEGVRENVCPRIALLLPNLERGGAERFAVELASELSNLGACVDLVVFESKGGLIDELDSRLRLVNLGSRFPPLLVARLIFYARRSKPKSILSFMPRANAVLGSARFFGLPCRRIIGSERSDESPPLGFYERKSERVIAPAMRTAYRRLDGITGVSSKVVERLIDRNLQPLGSAVTIPNFLMPPNGNVKIAASEVIRQRHVGSGQVLRLLSIGRLVPQKGFDDLLKAVALLQDVRPVTLTIIGEGPLYPDLMQLSDELGLTRQVEFVPNRRDLAPFFIESDVYVHAANYEGFGNVVLEALSWFLPVVSTDCPGPSAILRDGEYGILVPSGNPELLCQAILKAQANAKSSEELHSYLSSTFSRDTIGRRYLDFLVTGD
jgi:glycosyltransferase involved in cell wall biosynthesis